MMTSRGKHKAIEILSQRLRDINHGETFVVPETDDVYDIGLSGQAGSYRGSKDLAESLIESLEDAGVL